jgi:hypothetical protein
MKILPLGAQLFRADGRTEMTKLTVTFRKFANAPEKQDYYSNHLERQHCLLPVLTVFSSTQLLTTSMDENKTESVRIT